jgi:hypothetical protein
MVRQAHHTRRALRALRACRAAAAAAAVASRVLTWPGGDVQAKLTKNPAGYTLWCKELLGR